MDKQLMLYVQGELPTPKKERESVEQACCTYRKVRHGAFEVDGVMAFSEHLMERAVRLDRTRQILSQGDPALDLMLSGIEQDAIGAGRQIGRNLFTSWGL